jgi:hypothetical protein
VKEAAVGSRESFDVRVFGFAAAPGRHVRGALGLGSFCHFE